MAKRKNAASSIWDFRTFAERMNFEGERLRMVTELYGTCPRILDRHLLRAFKVWLNGNKKEDPRTIYGHIKG